MKRRERKANLGFMFMKSNYFAREKNEVGTITTFFSFLISGAGIELLKNKFYGIDPPFIFYLRPNFMINSVGIFLSSQK